MDRDFGAHGDFDDRAHAFSFQLWLNKNRQLLFGIGAALGTFAWALRRTREASQTKLKKAA